MKRAVLIAGLLVAFATPALGKGAAKHAAADKGKKASKTETSTDTTTSTSTATETEVEAKSEAPANTKVKTKTYTFGAMDVEGKLKTPQLLYFLNRVKLELDMSAPDKRSFMKELEKSADDKSL
jgi:hypothetical protein